MKLRSWLWLILGFSLALAASVFAQRGPGEYGGGWEQRGKDVYFLPTVGQVFLRDGTATLPAIAFAADKTTGFLRSAGGQIQFTAQGTASMIFAGSGALYLQNNSGMITFGSGNDLVIKRNAANILQQVSGTSTQTFFIGAATAIGLVQLGPSTFVNLPTPTNGTIAFCSDCDPLGAPGACTHVVGQTGSLAIFENSAWICL